MKGISTNVKKVMEDILDFLANWSFLQRSNAPSPSVLNQFIFNPELTQSEIRELSNLSIAKVYKELNRLLDMKLIEKTRKPSSNEVLYSMQRIDLALMNYMAENSKKIMNWMPKFKEMQDILHKNKSNFKDLDGYSEIVKWTNFFYKISEFYMLSYHILIGKKKELERIDI